MWRLIIRAVQRGIEVYVELAFDIDSRGRPTNIEVVSSEPGDSFDREVVRAVRQWRYEPFEYRGAALLLGREAIPFSVRY